MKTKIFSLLKTHVKRIIRKIAVFQAQKQLEQLHALNFPAANKISNAICDVIHYNLTPNEKGWVDQIEKLRRALTEDMTELTIIDYGAGRPDSTRKEEEMFVGVDTTRTVSRICRASKPRFWALFLFKLIREFKPMTSIELGTCLGISAAYQAAAHRLNKQGGIITLEGAATLASFSEKNLQILGFDNVQVVCGRFQDNLYSVLEENKPIDFAFIDGHHDEKATVSYYESFLPHLAEKAVIVFDDISWSKGMRRAWNSIIKDRNVKFFVDLRAIGICIFDRNMDKKPGLEIKLV